MIDHRNIEFLGVRMHAWSMLDTVEEIKHRISKKIFTQHVVVNVAKVINMQQDIELRRSIESCDIVNIDGMGVVWGARFLGNKVPERVAGIDLFHHLLEMSAIEGFKVFLLGATTEIVNLTADTVKSKYLGLDVAGYHHGYFWDNEEIVVEQIKQSGARLLFVAISSPKKENFINRWHEQLGVDFVMGVGGTFDVVAGKVKRAPPWMQKTGLEWLFRIIQEPARMWRRYLVTNSQFCLVLLWQKLGNLVGKL